MITLYLQEFWRRLKGRSITRKLARGRGASARLLVAPTDLRTADPFFGEEILAGRYPLAGRILDAGDQSPFAFELPSELFAVRLHSFAWLRNIRAHNTEEGRAQARYVIDDWIMRHGTRVKGVAWEPDVVAQRVIAWLSHSPVVLQEADGGFYRRFLSSLMQQIRFLRQQTGNMPDGLVRFRSVIALAMASVSIQCSASVVKRAARELDREIEHQILADGSHVSRNPQALVELLFDLLPLRQTYVNLGHDVPAKLIAGIDRMFPAIRFFRHHSRDLALFNGATATLANDLMAVLRYDETAGQPFKALPHSQFHRLSGGDTVVIVDTGHPLSPDLSRTAHAGCLSFELSSGRHRFVINAGAPRFAGHKLRQLARETAAHSTVVLGDRSSSRISKSSYLGPIFRSGVTEVDVNRQTGKDGSDRLIARHNGYVETFGVWHERDIRLSGDGNKIVGRDRIILPDGELASDVYPDPAVARFHIHPAIVLTQTDAQTIRMEAPGGECWLFRTLSGSATIEEDVFFADPTGLRPSEQIELVFTGPEVVWSLAHQL